MKAGSKPAPGIGLVVGILVLGSSVSIMSTDMYTPSMPDLAVWFDTSAQMVKLTISLNMLAFGLAQLLHGPLSDRFGRKPVLLASLAAVCVLCLVCAAAQSIEQLIIARILLGLAAAAEAVVGLAIIKDLYTEKQQVKALALLGMVIAITPAAAPIIGGYLHVTLGWQSNFIVTAAMAVVAWLAVARLLPESSVPDLHALKIRRIWGGYCGLLKNPDFMIHSAMLGVALGLIFVFVTGAPFVIIEMLGIQADHFGYYQAALVLAFFIGSLLASQLADYWDAKLLLASGVLIMITGVVALTLLILFFELTALIFTATYMIITLGMGPVFAVAPSRALRSIEGRAGTASALLSGIEHSVAAVAAVLISVLHNGSAQPMAWVTIVLGLLMLGLYRQSRRMDTQLMLR